MKKILIYSLLGLAFIITGCGTQVLNNNEQIDTENNNTNIVIQNFAFTPDVLTVSQGTTVTWTNNDLAPHEIKSETFNSDKLDKGGSFSFTFNQPGNYDYICSIHPSMKGKIIVK